MEEKGSVNSKGKKEAEHDFYTQFPKKNFLFWVVTNSQTIK